MFIPCFYIPLPFSVNAEVIYTQTIHLVLWGVKKVRVDGREVNSMPEGVRRRRWGWVGKGCTVKGIHFIQTVCLAIHLELQVISSLTAPPVLSADSKMTKRRKKKTKQTANDWTGNTILKVRKKKHVQSENPNSPSTHGRPFPAINHKNIQNKRFYLCFFIGMHWFNTDRLVKLMQTAELDISNDEANLISKWPKYAEMRWIQSLK